MKSFSHYVSLSLCCALPNLALAKPHKSAGGSSGATPSPLISSELAGADLQFLVSMASLDHIQILLGDAAQRAETDQVKAVGAAMKSAQADEAQYLAEVAARKGVDLHNVAPSSEEKKIAEQLHGLTGAKLEKTLMEKIVAANKEEVSLLEGASHSDDSQIRQFATRALPVAKQKLQIASEIIGVPLRPADKPAFRSGGPIEAPVSQ